MCVVFALCFSFCAYFFYAAVGTTYRNCTWYQESQGYHVSPFSFSFSFVPLDPITVYMYSSLTWAVYILFSGNRLAVALESVPEESSIPNLSYTVRSISSYPIP